MIDQVKTSYSHCDVNHCHQRLIQSFFLKDENPGKCLVILTNNDATCFIDNPRNKIIDFLAIDACLIGGEKKKCDAVVADNNSIWFIELKEVIWSNRPAKDRRKRKNVRKKAVQQLASTINDFKTKGINLDQLKVVALISFPPFTVDINPITIPTASSQARVLEFVNLCGYTDLFEGNHIVF